MIRFVVSRASSALLLCAIIACGGDDSKGTEPSDDASEDATQTVENAEDAAPENTGPVEYANSEDGLAKLFDDLIISLLDNESEARAIRLTLSFVLPDHQKWISEHFGAGSRGKRLMRAYAKVKDDIGSLSSTLRGTIEKSQTKVTVNKFTKPDDELAVGYQSKALAVAKKNNKELELYSVRLSDDGDKVFHVWSFVHVDGTFRYIGKLKGLVTGKARRPSPETKTDTLEFTSADAARIMAAESPPDAGPR